MKTTGKDIMMICKGHFNHKKYKTVKNALEAYYRKEYRIVKEVVPDLTFFSLFSFLIKDCIKEIITVNNLNAFFENVISKVILNNFNGNNHEYAFNTVVNWLASIKVKDQNDNWIIDLSDYDSDCMIV